MNVEAYFKNISTDELIFKTELQPTNLDTLSNVTFNNEQEDTSRNSRFTLHATDGEGMKREYDLVGISLNQEAVVLDVINSKGYANKVVIEKKDMTRKEYEAYVKIHNELTEKE